MLTCIYVAWSSKAGHQNIRLEFDEDKQMNLFDECIFVPADQTKADKLADSICTRISYSVYQDLFCCSHSHENDVLDNIYRVLILAFKYGPSALVMYQYKDIMRHRDIRQALGNEAYHFKEFLRFHEVRRGLYVAHFEPKSRVVEIVAAHFEDRMPSEHWMIIDDVHREAVIHPKDSRSYIRLLNDEEFNLLCETENVNDVYTDLWTLFFNSIAIKQRENKACQDNHIPIWKRKHVIEFNHQPSYSSHQ